MPPSPLSTRGPLPARVYWTRRLLLLGVALALVVGLARLLGSSSDGSDPGSDRATTAGATTSATTGATTGATTSATASASPTEQGRRERTNKQTPTEPPLAEPSGPCESSDVMVTPTIVTADGGADVPITLNLRTLRTPACTWRVSPETLTVSITSGDDFIWASRQCPNSITTQDVVVRQAVETPIVIVWNDARRSDEDCSDLADWARPGYYHVEAAALGGEPTDVQFELVRPPSAVITKTVTPKPEPQPTSSGKPGRQGDSEHTPGEQGGGNSEG